MRTGILCIPMTDNLSEICKIWLAQGWGEREGRASGNNLEPRMPVKQIKDPPFFISTSRHGRQDGGCTPLATTRSNRQTLTTGKQEITPQSVSGQSQHSTAPYSDGPGCKGAKEPWKRSTMRISRGKTHSVNIVSVHKNSNKVVAGEKSKDRAVLNLSSGDLLADLTAPCHTVCGSLYIPRCLLSSHWRNIFCGFL